MYKAARDETFVDFLKNLFKKANIKESFIELCLEKKEEFYKAFTSSSADAENNYEYYEQLGDVTVNKFIVSYMYNRFPVLKTPKGVEVVARLKIKYGSKETLYEIAKNLGFWKFISAAEDVRDKQQKSLLEDVFESFIGCTEEVVDNIIKEIKGCEMPGVGYHICWQLLSSIFNELKISIDYSSLVDSKTKLKELFDENKNNQLKYIDNQCPETRMFTSNVYNNHQWLGSGVSALRKQAQSKAANAALKNLEKIGIRKKIPDFYKQITLTDSTSINQLGGDHHFQ